MGAAEIIALIKDIFVIAALGVLIVVLSVAGILLFRIYYLAKRATNGVERATGVIYNVVAQPLNIIGAGLEAINRVLGMVDQLRKRERRNEDDEL